METPTKEQLQAFMDHPEEIENVIEAFNDDTVEWLPYQIVLKLIEHKLWEPGETAIHIEPEIQTYQPEACTRCKTKTSELTVISPFPVNDPVTKNAHWLCSECLEKLNKNL